MKGSLKGLLTASACALVLSLTSCQSSGQHIDDHWNVRSIPPRIVRASLGYDASRDGTFLGHMGRNMSDVGLVFVRYFFNYNPDSPYR